MEKKTYHCDRCKAEVKEDTDLKTVSFGVYEYRRGFNPEYPKFKIDMCVKCREKIGLAEIVLKEGAAVEREIETTADKLYNLLVDLVNENIPYHEG